MAKFCPNCGVAISAETLKFCPECGTPLTQSAENASATPQQKPSTPKLNMMKKVYKCPDCGSYYDIDNAPNNCRGCGCFRGLFSLVDVDASFSIEGERKNEEKRIEKKKLAGFLIVIILLFSIPIFYGISTRDVRPSSTKTETSSKSSESGWNRISTIEEFQQQFVGTTWTCRPVGDIWSKFVVKSTDVIAVYTSLYKESWGKEKLFYYRVKKETDVNTGERYIAVYIGELTSGEERGLEDMGRTLIFVDGATNNSFYQFGDRQGSLYYGDYTFSDAL